MHCPNCGQTQPIEDARYCSRCGLSLWELARWLRDGVNAPWNPIPPKTEMSPRRKGIRRGAKLMFAGGVLFPFMLLFAIAVDGPEVLFLPVTIFFVGMVLALYARLFSDAYPAPPQPLPVQPYRPNEYLPPAPVNAQPVLRAREPNTSEIIQPPSVTEYTTNLLRDRTKT